MHHSLSRRLFVAAMAGIAIAASTAPVVGAAPTKSGFKTSQPAMLTLGPAAIGGSVEALLTVGDTLNGYTFEAIPDGISVFPNGKGTVSVYINHETSTVPFPYNAAAPTASNGQNDFDNSQVSELLLHQGSAGILKGSFAIASSANFQRFCSNFLATSAEGFSRPILFTNEEGIDWVNETGTAWTNAASLEGAVGARQIGAVVAHDVKNGKTKTIWGMGRLNHENNVAVPGYGYPVLLSGDDAFNQNAPQSQVYSYIADDGDAVWNDQGKLYAFVPDTAYATVNDYYDFPVGSAASISGHFVEVPKNIATGKNPDGTDLMSTDLGYPTPPTDGTWQRPPGATTGAVDGPQWVLEHWGDLNNVFQFLRIEDIATDKRSGKSNVVYLADSGRGSASVAAGAAFASTNGRVWKMVLDPSDPTKVTSLSILIEGDDSPLKTVAEIHQPDNLETTQNGLYIQEDTGSGQSFTPQQQIDDAARATTARIWQYKFTGDTSGTLGVVAKVDQSADEGLTDVDPSGLSRWGDWESSGIIDVSSIFGPGKFLVTVQAHTLWVEKADGPDGPDSGTAPDWTWKREGGQLLLITIPGG
jgi:hypothetical protein